MGQVALLSVDFGRNVRGRHLFEGFLNFCACRQVIERKSRR